MTTGPGKFSVNGRDYPAPRGSVVVICLDGCERDYLDRAISAGRMPVLERLIAGGTSTTASSTIPSFTNPNNLSIATGAPPEVHGICGNYFHDPDSGKDMMMNDPKFLRAPTLFSAAQESGARVAVVTAKDKLRALLGNGLAIGSNDAWCFSAERASETSSKVHGIDNAAAWLGFPQPDVYSAELSEFVLAAGVKLLDEFRPDVMYLTTTDYIQHKFAPGEPVPNAFYAKIDEYLGQLDEFGAAIVVTADHGMKPKHDADGKPQVVYVQDLLDDWLGEGTSRVILPITDPYVVHHGSLGSFATAYLSPEVDAHTIRTRLEGVEGLETVRLRSEACAEFQLPEDRIGDLVLLSGECTTIGSSRDRHDLDALDAPLRSHGGLHEQQVPFIVNRKLKNLSVQEVRNYDAFAIAFQAASGEVQDARIH